MIKTALVACAAIGALFVSVTSFSAQGAELSGTIKIDGSSTVFPLSEKVAEGFMKANPKVKVTVAQSGTGGGFKKFGRGETDISDASRPIKSSEADACDALGIKYMGLPVAFDALSVVINKDNTWAEKMTQEELKKMWEPAAEGKVMNWSQVRDGWPNEKMVLYGAGADSGTFDYFTEAIVGTSKSQRTDYTPSEDDHVTVKGVEGNKNGMGYFGYSYFVGHKDKMKAIAIKPTGGADFIAPSEDAVLKGTYKPLGRLIYIYVSDKAAKRTEVLKFVEYYLNNMKQAAKDSGFIPLTDDLITKAKKRFTDREWKDSDLRK